jgi:uncharacterized protein YjbJ (UPF0337 family)
MNSDQLKAKWKQVKWSVTGKLTDDDSDVSDGNHDQLLGKTQERYGITRVAAQKQVEQNSTESCESDTTERLRAS